VNVYKHDPLTPISSVAVREFTTRPLRQGSEICFKNRALMSVLLNWMIYKYMYVNGHTEVPPAITFTSMDIKIHCGSLFVLKR
jgi:hypothetical protein